MVTPDVLKPGYGRLYETSELSDINELPTPLFVVKADDFHRDYNIVNHRRGYVGSISLGIGEAPNMCLTDAELLSAVSAIIQYLSRGFAVVIHAANGSGRHMYLSLAIIMRVKRVPLSEAMNGYIFHVGPFSSGFSEVKLLESLALAEPTLLS